MPGRRVALLWACACLGGCASPPEPECRTTPGETELAIDCEPESDDDEWSERARREALEGFEERSPGGRP